MLKSSIIEHLNFDVRGKQVYINDSCQIIYIKPFFRKKGEFTKKKIFYTLDCNIYIILYNKSICP